ncbi:hypothetical protein KCU89_g46, partial [Aureobasidium melanogenum]
MTTKDAAGLGDVDSVVTVRRRRRRHSIRGPFCWNTRPQTVRVGMYHMASWRSSICRHSMCRVLEYHRGGARLLKATSIQTMLTNSTTISPALGSSSTPQVHVVTVGKGAHRFDPETLTASAGDVVTFEFFPLNHSVVRAQYRYPCIPYEDVVVGQEGFFSGLIPVSDILDDPPKWNLTINDTSPIFFYCSAPGSCIDYQMVGAINPLTSWKNLSTPFFVQKDGAKDSNYMLQPGEDFPSEASGSVSSDSSAETSGSKATSDVAGLAPPTIAGIVLGVLGMCCVTLAILLTLYLRYRGRKRVKLVEMPAPSSSTETSTTIRDMIPEQVHGQVPCQILDRPENQTSVIYLSSNSISCGDILEQQIRALRPRHTRPKGTSMNRCYGANLLHAASRDPALGISRSEIAGQNY